MERISVSKMFPPCPSDDFSCPYYGKKTGRCLMFEKEAVLPYEECDNFFEVDDSEEDGFTEFEVGKFNYDEFSANP